MKGYIMKYSTQFVIWNSKGDTKVANITLEDNTEGNAMLESLLNLRDTDNHKYMMDPI
jgi:hypothetical protein